MEFDKCARCGSTNLRRRAISGGYFCKRCGYDSENYKKDNA